MAKSFLVVTGGPGEGERHVVEQDEASLGRDAQNDLVIPDAQISRRHALLRRRGDLWEVEDLGSTNGTFVNDVPVSGVTALGPDDTLRVGRTTMRLEVEEEDEEVAALPVDEPALEGEAADELAEEAADEEAPPELAEEAAEEPPEEPSEESRPALSLPAEPLPAFAADDSEDSEGVAPAALDSRYAGRVLVSAVVLVVLVIFVIAVLVTSH